MHRNSEQIIFISALGNPRQNKCSFHNLSSFDYIVAKEFILYECADLDIGKDTNLPIDVLIPPVQCHEFIKVYCTSLLTWGNLFAKYYLSEYFRTFYKGKIILVTFPRSPSTNLAEFDEALVKRWLKQITIWEDHFTVELKSGLKIDIEG